MVLTRRWESIPTALFVLNATGALLVKIFDENPQMRILFVFGFAVIALLMLIFASMVEMPLRAVFTAIAVSAIIFLGVATLGSKLPGGKN